MFGGVWAVPSPWSSQGTVALAVGLRRGRVPQFFLRLSPCCQRPKVSHSWGGLQMPWEVALAPRVTVTLKQSQGGPSRSTGLSCKGHCPRPPCAAVTGWDLTLQSLSPNQGWPRGVQESEPSTCGPVRARVRGVQTWGRKRSVSRAEPSVFLRGTGDL